MDGWETLLAAVGGLLVGLGLGVTIGRRGDARYRLEQTRIETSVRTSVVPVLEARADELGLSRKSDPSDGAVTSAVTLADAIRKHESRGALPFNDTVQLERRELDASAEPEPLA